MMNSLLYDMYIHMYIDLYIHELPRHRSILSSSVLLLKCPWSMSQSHVWWLNHVKSRVFYCSNHVRSHVLLAKSKQNHIFLG